MTHRPICVRKVPPIIDSCQFRLTSQSVFFMTEGGKKQQQKKTKNKTTTSNSRLLSCGFFSPGSSTKERAGSVCWWLVCVVRVLLQSTWWWRGQASWTGLGMMQCVTLKSNVQTLSVVVQTLCAHGVCWLLEPFLQSHYCMHMCRETCQRRKEIFFFFFSRASPRSASRSSCEVTFRYGI